MWERAISTRACERERPTAAASAETAAASAAAEEEEVKGTESRRRVSARSDGGRNKSPKRVRFRLIPGPIRQRFLPMKFKKLSRLNNRVVFGNIPKLKCFPNRANELQIKQQHPVCQARRGGGGGVGASSPSRAPPPPPSATSVVGGRAMRDEVTGGGGGGGDRLNGRARTDLLRLRFVVVVIRCW